jgi:hypothetical protein
MTPFRLDDDEPDPDEEEEDDFEEDEDKGDDEDDEDEEDEDGEEEETWQVSLLTSPIELPRLAGIFQLSQAGIDSAGSRRSRF